METFSSVINILYVATALAILVYAVDDIYMDLYYWCFKAWRQKHYNKNPLTMDKLNALPEQRLALMVPCWQESTVVADMLSNTLDTLHYENYDIFIGVYPNDQLTINSLATLAKKNSRVHLVQGKDPGPTTKAQNLNAIYEGIRTYEGNTGAQFDIFVMHDAEDVIHPVSFKLYNYLMPKKDMIQIPVFPLESRLSWFTHWSYADEFAESHTKDLITREWMGGFVPSAGVGTAFSRKALIGLEKETGCQLFSAETLTEDYAFSLFLNRHGLSAAFVQQSIRRVRTKPAFGYFGPLKMREEKEWIATRSLFPTNYKNAIRQKSRWILGIALQEWKATGWGGTGKTKYSLVRDRKAPVGHVLVAAAYIILSYWLFYHASIWLTGSSPVPPLTPLNQTLFILVTAVMIHRLTERAVAVARIYGLVPALLSIPRSVYLNVVNIHAFSKSLMQFNREQKRNERVAWAKTVNRFPTRDQLQPFRRRFGDALIENSLATVPQIENALSQQTHDKRPLGRILKDNGVLSEDDLLLTLSKVLSINVAQSDDLAKARPDYDGLPAEIKSKAAQLGAVWLQTPDNTLLFAIDNSADLNRVEALKKNVTGRDIRFVLAREADLRQIASPS